jgi:hypothetical protein
MKMTAIARRGMLAAVLAAPAIARGMLAKQ